ncbi:hypothetical protein D3C73_1432080 [compost metagenome]
MRRHGNARGVFQPAGLDGLDRPFTGIGGRGAAKTIEGFFQVESAVVDAFVIGLPALQEGVANQVTIAVIHVAQQ